MIPSLSLLLLAASCWETALTSTALPRRCVQLINFSHSPGESQQPSCSSETRWFLVVPDGAEMLSEGVDNQGDAAQLLLLPARYHRRTKSLMSPRDTVTLLAAPDVTHSIFASASSRSCCCSPPLATCFRRQSCSLFPPLGGAKHAHTTRTLADSWLCAAMQLLLQVSCSCVLV